MAVLALTACSSAEPRRTLGVLTVAVSGDQVCLGRSVTYGQDGTFELSSMIDPELRCYGRFRYDRYPDGVARFRCSDGDTGVLRIRAEGPFVGSGSGTSSRGPLAIAFGYSVPRMNARLPLPAGMRLAVVGDTIVLLEVKAKAQPAAANAPAEAAPGEGRD